MRAERGDLAWTRLDYQAAAEHLETAADLVPASAPLVRADHLSGFGKAAHYILTDPARAAVGGAPDGIAC